VFFNEGYNEQLFFSLTLTKKLGIDPSWRFRKKKNAKSA